MRQYLDLLEHVLDHGVKKEDRTGTGTLSVFGWQMRFDLSEGFPLLTTKKMFTAGLIDELIWFISGSTNVNDLPDRTKKWWTPWQSADGGLGPIYGEQYRRSRWWFQVVPDIREQPKVCKNQELFAGVGDIGTTSRTMGQSREMAILKSTWREMLKRCYAEKSKAFKHYGATGVHVDTAWLNFDNFMRDAAHLPGWNMKRMWPSYFSLDKDTLAASNCYSAETCMWASHDEQGYNTSTNKPFYATSPEGTETLFASIGEMHRVFGMNLSAVHRCLNKKLVTHHGWSNFRYAEGEGKVFRFREVDQLMSLIANLVYDPHSRRHMINLWHTPAMAHANLPCCHGSVIQFHVANGELSASVYQRSVDTLIGLPVNIASYALLTLMVAQVCGYEPGDFVWTGGDCHLYLNHLEQAKLQLTREPRKLPTMKLNQDVKDIFEFKFEDFTLEGYDPHPHIKAEVAV